MNPFRFLDVLTNPLVDHLAGGAIYGVRTGAGGGNPDPLTLTQASEEAAEWNSYATVGAHVKPYEDWTAARPPADHLLDLESTDAIPDWADGGSEPDPGYYQQIEAIGDGLAQIPGALEHIDEYGLHSFLDDFQV